MKVFDEITRRIFVVTSLDDDWGFVYVYYIGELWNGPSVCGLEVESRFKI